MTPILRRLLAVASTPILIIAGLAYIFTLPIWALLRWAFTGNSTFPAPPNELLCALFHWIAGTETERP